MSSVAAKAAMAALLAMGLMTTACQAHSDEQERLCTGDAFRLCGDDIPDVQRITACMIRKKALLSPGCRSVFGPDPAVRPAALRRSKPVNLRPVRARRRPA